MFDEKAQQVLAYIRSVSKDGTYKVIDANDIVSAVSGGLTLPELSQIIKDLADRDYVLVKFATLSDYCVAPSNKAIIEEERREALAKRMLEEQNNLLRQQGVYSVMAASGTPQNNGANASGYGQNASGANGASAGSIGGSAAVPGANPAAGAYQQSNPAVSVPQPSVVGQPIQSASNIGTSTAPAIESKKGITRAADTKRKLKLFWICFAGAFAGGVLGAIVNLIIMLTTK